MTGDQKRPKGAGKSSFGLVTPNILADALPVGTGSVVLDLACGKGNYSIFLSEIVGNTGLIYAFDLWEEGLQILRKEIEEKNISTILPLLNNATEEIEIDDDNYNYMLLFQKADLHV